MRYGVRSARPGRRSALPIRCMGTAAVLLGLELALIAPCGAQPVGNEQFASSDRYGEEFAEVPARYPSCADTVEKHRALTKEERAEAERLRRPHTDTEGRQIRENIDTLSQERNDLLPQLIQCVRRAETAERSSLQLQGSVEQKHIVREAPPTKPAPGPVVLSGYAQKRGSPVTLGARTPTPDSARVPLQGGVEQSAASTEPVFRARTPELGATSLPAGTPPATNSGGDLSAGNVSGRMLPAGAHATAQSLGGGGSQSHVSGRLLAPRGTARGGDTPAGGARRIELNTKAEILKHMGGEQTYPGRDLGVGPDAAGLSDGIMIMSHDIGDGYARYLKGAKLVLQGRATDAERVMGLNRTHGATFEGWRQSAERLGAAMRKNVPGETARQRYERYKLYGEAFTDLTFNALSLGTSVKVPKLPPTPPPLPSPNPKGQNAW